METNDRLAMHGKFIVEHWRDGQRIGAYECPNTIVNEGRNHILGVEFNAQTPITTWYIGLVDNANFSAITLNDNYDNIDQAGNGWDEFKDYEDVNNGSSAVTRPAWPEDAPSGQAITNTSFALYDITGSGTVKGLFLCGGTNAATKGDHTSGTAHKLWCATLFAGGDVAVAPSDQLRVVYALTW